MNNSEEKTTFSCSIYGEAMNQIDYLCVDELILVRLVAANHARLRAAQVQVVLRVPLQFQRLCAPITSNEQKSECIHYRKFTIASFGIRFALTQ